MDLFETYVSYVDDWQFHQLSYQPPLARYNLLIVGQFGSTDPDDYGFIALDDVLSYYGPCLSTRVCDFEGPDLCWFQQSNADDFDWLHLNGQNCSEMNCPIMDHTTNSINGKFMSIPPTQANDTSPKHGELVTITLRKVSEACISFWYYFDGEGKDNLEVVKTIPYESVNEVEILAKITGDLFPGWNPLRVSLTSDDSFQLNIIAHVFSDTPIMAFDDFELNRHEFCSNPMSCDFETGDFCTWSQDWQDDLDFELKTGYEDNNGIGPNEDHTSGTELGHYIFLASKGIQESGLVARIVSEPYIVTSANAKEGQCLIFSYYLVGNQAGTLLVNKIDVNSETPTKVFEVAVDDGNLWQLARINLQSEVTFRLEILALTGEGEEGEIGLDDLLLERSSCQDNTHVFTCDDGAEIPITLKCNFHPECKNGEDERGCGNCDFENGACEWNNIETESVFKWVVTHSNNTDPDSLAPDIDHSTMEPIGHYALAEIVSGEGNLKEALFASPNLQECAHDCTLRFWVYLDSTEKGDLLIVKLAESVTTPRPIFSLDEHAVALEWVQYFVPIGRIRHSFVILFEAHPISGAKNAFALDDVALEECGIPHGEQDPCNDNEQFTCDTGHCISKWNVCDMTDNCGDESDERHCEASVQCNFEDGLCMWSNLYETQGQWRIGKADGTHDLPYRDHSRNLYSGHFLIPELTKNSSEVTLASPVFLPGVSFNLTFHHQTTGHDKPDLKILSMDLETNVETVLSHQTEFDVFGQWIKQTVFIPATEHKHVREQFSLRIS